MVTCFCGAAFGSGRYANIGQERIYLHIYNLQGDVPGLMSAAGDNYCNYVYDTCGKFLSIKMPAATTKPMTTPLPERRIPSATVGIAMTPKWVYTISKVGIILQNGAGSSMRMYI